jgi:uncharacterized coiled-coil protein SlyX
MSQDSEARSLPEQVQDHERRLTELEIEAAFHRKTNEDLDEVVREQGERIAVLERRIAELIGQLELVDSDTE